MLANYVIGACVSQTTELSGVLFILELNTTCLASFFSTIDNKVCAKTTCFDINEECGSI